jgi:hypothetical protein
MSASLLASIPTTTIDVADSRTPVANAMKNPKPKFSPSRTVTSGRVWTMVFGDVAAIDEPAEHGRTGR